MIVLGVDPGLTGAVCAIDAASGALLECADLPTCDNGTASGSMKRWVDDTALDALLASWATKHDFVRRDLHAAIERPIPMPSLPAQTIASQFDTFGTVRAVLRRRAKLRFVNPTEWKRLFGFGRDKDEARACCLRLYPDAPVTRAKDHNRAESVLIAHWLRRELA